MPVSLSHSQMPMPAARVASALRSVASRSAASASSRSVTSMDTPLARYGLPGGSARARDTTMAHLAVGVDDAVRDLQRRLAGA